MRVERIGWLWVGFAVACGGGSVRGTTSGDPPSGDRTATARGVAQAALDPRVTAAVARVSEAEVRADLERIAAQPRVASDQPGDPAARHLAETADHIARAFEAAGLRVTRQSVEHEGLRADNIIGDRLGSDPTRVVILAAHHDSVAGSPGADDNASGVAGMLAVARATAGVRTAACLRFIAFAFEEPGLVGSAAYVRQLPRGEGERIEAAIALDMIGFRARGPGSQRYPLGAETMVLMSTGRRLPQEGDFIGWFAISSLPPRVTTALHEAREYVPSLHVFDLQLPREALLQAPDLTRGDHASFWQAGLHGIAVGDTGDFRNRHYHQPTDSVATLDLGFATDVSRWLTAAILLVAAPH